MKAAAIGIVMSFLLVACSGSDATGPSSPPSTVPSSPSPASPSPVEKPTLSPSGFCTDRSVVGDLYHLVRAGTVPYRQAAASATAVGKLMRADADLASTDLAARKMREFVLYLNTLRLAILGAAVNYPDDFAVKQFTNGLIDRVAEIADALNCPPPA
jgi:hypothetical protein